MFKVSETDVWFIAGVFWGFVFHWFTSLGIDMRIINYLTKIKKNSRL